MTTILGIDGDTFRIAYCVINVENDRPSIASVGTIDRRSDKKKDAGCFLPGYVEGLRKILYPVLEADGLVFIENCFLGHNRKTFSSLSQVKGELNYEIMALYGAKRKPIFIEPSSWQSKIGYEFGTPFKRLLSTKDCSLLCATKILGYAPPTNHEADATCIAFYGHLTRDIYANDSEEKEVKVARKRKTYSRRRVRAAL